MPRKRADELFDRAFAAKWARGQPLDAETRAVHRTVLRLLLAGKSPVSGAAIAADSGLALDSVDAALGRLDTADFVMVTEGRVRLAYPLSAAPTGFAVAFDGGRLCHACCAIDALGLPAMTGEAATIRASCHHCGEALTLRVEPEGPADSHDLMVWVGERGDLRGKACDTFCHTLNFFRSDEHASAWWAGHPAVPGAAATLAEGFRLAERVFGGLLGPR